ncbi:MAG TPA: hypothetical protein VE053_09875 [Allosphingosinicella sp.]|nr:hypothetical protein [Allosphingosinicella sp.]
MTALVLPAPVRRLPFLSELVERQRTLAFYGLATFLLALPVLALQAIDPRTLHGVGIWLKPAKFLVSVGVFSITMAWFWGYVRPERREAPALRWAVRLLIASASFELLYIGLQAARGLDSHFNFSSAFHIALYALMGVAAVILTATTLPLAWEIARRPRQGLGRDFVAAVGIGLLLTFLLGAGLGGYMSTQPGHSVGTEGGRIFFFGWNRSGGDLRIAHFLGIHAQQAIPLLAALAAGWSVRARWATLAAGTLAYVALTLAIFFQAVAGRPLLPA